MPTTIYVRSSFVTNGITANIALGRGQHTCIRGTFDPIVLTGLSGVTLSFTLASTDGSVTIPKTVTILDATLCTWQVELLSSDTSTLDLTLSYYYQVSQTSPSGNFPCNQGVVQLQQFAANS